MVQIFTNQSRTLRHERRIIQRQGRRAIQHTRTKHGTQTKKPYSRIIHTLRRVAKYRKKSSVERRNGQLDPTQTGTDGQHAQETTSSLGFRIQPPHLQLK